MEDKIVRYGIDRRPARDLRMNSFADPGMLEKPPRTPFRDGSWSPERQLNARDCSHSPHYRRTSIEETRHHVRGEAGRRPMTALAGPGSVG
jgi:hypothetical protein